ncbi:MAG: hypothetical protein IT305_17905 [Chloroflexi bacterium]|nr:hypothetical protein [Chloroflexota bacterium]
MSGRAVAVATDVGAWRVVWPVVNALRDRGRTLSLMLAQPAASYAEAAGISCVRLDAPSPEGRAEQVLAERPSSLLLGTSVQPCVERVLTRRARGRIPTLGVLDAMLFAELRFADRRSTAAIDASSIAAMDASSAAAIDVLGDVRSNLRGARPVAARGDGPSRAGTGGLGDLPNVLACPDSETAERLLQAGAPAGSVIGTGNPTLAEIGLTAAKYPVAANGVAPAQPMDVLFVSQAVTNRHLPGNPFSIDERQTLDDVLAALGGLRALSPAGFRVRVRWHPTQRPDRVPNGPDGVRVEADDDADRLRSAGRARVVVGLSSTLMGEARMLGRAAIAYLPGPYWDQEPVYPASLGVRLARTNEQLRAYLRAALLEPPAPAPLAEHLGAADRIADLFDQLAGTPTV